MDTSSTSSNTATASRALSLLGNGVSSEVVAAALGVSPSRISQLLSDETFAAQVSALRFENLQKHTITDGKYDSIEDRLLEKLELNLPLMMRPMEILKALAVVNGAKRRGVQVSPESAGNIGSGTIVNLLMPVQVLQKYAVQVNIMNQVVKTGDTDLVTIQSGTLMKMVGAGSDGSNK